MCDVRLFEVGLARFLKGTLSRALSSMHPQLILYILAQQICQTLQCIFVLICVYALDNDKLIYLQRVLQR